MTEKIASFWLAQSRQIYHKVLTCTAEMQINALVLVIFSVIYQMMSNRMKARNNSDSFKLHWHNGSYNFERHLTLKVPLSTQVYKRVPTNLMLGITLWWISIPSKGE